MATRQRSPGREQQFESSHLGSHHFDLDELSDAELEELLFDEEPEPKSGFWNLPTIAGLAMVTVGVAYLFQQMGMLGGLDFSLVAAMLPWLAGILIILLGLGVLSWRPSKKKRKKAVDVKTGKSRVVEEKEVTTEKSEKKKGRWRLTKSRRDRKIFGVCGGIAEQLNIDATLVRIVFVVGTIFGQGAFLLAYLALAYLMPNPEEAEERITIIRDS